MNALSLATLFTVATVAQLLEVGLSVARTVGLPVDSWRAGDPTRSIYLYLAEVLESLEQANAEYIRAGFLSTATGDWLTVLALEVYGVTRIEATFAACTITLDNGGGGNYPLDEVGEWTFKNSVTNKTYHSISTGVVLAPGGSITIDIIADEAGSDSSVGVGEIDEIVTTLLGVAIDDNTAGVGVDQQSKESLKEQCTDTLGALSPNGPADAYEYVARNPDLTLAPAITKAKSSGDNATGTATCHVATAAGVPSAPDVVLVQTAFDKWATPLGFAATAVAASGVTTAVTINITGASLPVTAQADAEAAILAHFASINIAGLLSRSDITHEVQVAVPEIDTSSIQAPAVDVQAGTGEVNTPGVITVSIV